MTSYLHNIQMTTSRPRIGKGELTPDPERESINGLTGLRYERLYHRLVELDNIRRQQRQRLAQYKQLETLIEPLKDPQANIQPNLITRDSELVQEIDRMRMLVARVAGRVSQTRVIPLGDRSATIPSTDPDQKLAAVLDMT